MLTLTSTDLARNLRETNGRLRCLLDSLNQDPDADPGQDRALDQRLDQGPDVVRSVALRLATPQQMHGLLSELMRAGGCLRSLPAERDAALDDVVEEYRQNVERLRALLPAIHAALLWERSRLEQERARVRGAADWARLSRQTF